ncbi:MAG: hypothetical protein AAF687_00930 [Pseudomonadota bacterium]
MAEARSLRVGSRTRTLLIALSTALVAAAAFANSLVNINHARLPDFALAFDGDDPVALVNKAQSDLASGALSAEGSDAVLSIVRRSVAQLPLNAPAFRLLGLSSAANADLPGVRAQMAISERMERRDPAAQLWLIEDAVQRNDVAGALRHYDLALRNDESTRAVLYPVLTDAMENAAIRARFVPYMSAPPPWLESFLRFAVSQTQQPVAIADLAKRAGGFPDGAPYTSLDRELLTQLVAFEDFEAAIAHFKRIKDADLSAATTLALTDKTTDEAYMPITWQAFSIDGIEPFVLSSPEGAGAVEIEAELEAGYTGPVARKLVALKPGSYTVTAAMRAEDFGGLDRAVWSITCAGGSGAPLANDAVDLADEFDLRSSFTVPADCPVQLALVSAETTLRTGYLKLVLAEIDLKRGQPTTR